MLELVKWSETFENSDMRKRQRLGWFLSPTGCDSKGYRRLLRMGREGLEALGFFQCLCQAMATLPYAVRRSNTFKHTDGTLMEMDDILEISRLNGRDSAETRQIIGRLVACGWIIIRNPLNSQQSASHLPVICHPSPGFVKGEGEGEGEGEGQQTADRPPAPIEFPDFPDNETDMTTDTKDQMQTLMDRINACYSCWRKRPQFTRMEMDKLMANAKLVADIADDDWKLLAVYLQCEIPAEWGKFWQPEGRSKFIDTLPDVLANADRWRAKCKKERINTGLEPQ